MTRIITKEPELEEYRKVQKQIGQKTKGSPNTSLLVNIPANLARIMFITKGSVLKFTLNKNHTKIFIEKV